MAGDDVDTWNANKAPNRTQDRWNLIRDIEFSPSLRYCLYSYPGLDHFNREAMRDKESGPNDKRTISGVQGSALMGVLGGHFMGEKINKQVAIQILNRGD